MIRTQLVTGLRALAVLTIICGLAYPLVVTAAAQLAFADKANGSLISHNGRVVGSALLGQTFTSEKYFHSRPSAAGALAAGSAGADVDVDDLSQVASGASNLGPTNDELTTQVAERAAAYRKANGLAPRTPVPVDAVTASGSGVDPHISVANARLQAPRVASARGLTLDTVRGLIDANTTGRSLGMLGEPGVNVLELNLALDRLASGR